jgi:Tfp pilus assembly protein PilF
MERCPNCRAANEESEQCRRCGMDFTQLLAAEAAAETLIRYALIYLGAGDTPAAVRSLRRALSLHHDPYIDLLLRFAGERQGDWALVAEGD